MNINIIQLSNVGAFSAGKKKSPTKWRSEIRGVSLEQRWCQQTSTQRCRVRGRSQSLRGLGGATFSIQTSGESRNSQSTRMTIAWPKIPPNSAPFCLLWNIKTWNQRGKMYPVFASTEEVSLRLNQQTFLTTDLWLGNELPLPFKHRNGNRTLMTRFTCFQPVSDGYFVCEHFHNGRIRTHSHSSIQICVCAASG